MASAEAALRAAGCVAADEEAVELWETAGGDGARLAELVGRRCVGEPLAWLVGSVRFCGERVAVHPGVYVPRWQSEPLAEEASDRLPDRGIAVDLCTGAGAIALVLARRRPRSQVLATENDLLAVACARANGVDVHPGDMTAALPRQLRGQVDVVVGVVPYVPTAALHLLPRDVQDHEPRAALDGGEGGLGYLVQAAREAAPLLRPDGWLLLELGGRQDAALLPHLVEHGYTEVQARWDEDGDLRAVVARRMAARPLP